MAFQEVFNLADYKSIVENFNPGDSLAVRIVRNGNGSFIMTKLKISDNPFMKDASLTNTRNFSSLPT